MYTSPRIDSAGRPRQPAGTRHQRVPVYVGPARRGTPALPGPARGLITRDNSGQNRPCVASARRYDSHTVADMSEPPRPGDAGSDPTAPYTPPSYSMPGETPGSNYSPPASPTSGPAAPTSGPATPSSGGPSSGAGGYTMPSGGDYTPPEGGG